MPHWSLTLTLEQGRVSAPPTLDTRVRTVTLLVVGRGLQVDDDRAARLERKVRNVSQRHGRARHNAQVGTCAVLVRLVPVDLVQALAKVDVGCT